MPVIKSKKKPEVEQKQNMLPRTDLKLMEPGVFEVSKESNFTIKIPLAVKDGWWKVVPEEDSEVVHEAVFRMWNYDEMIGLKKMATHYDQAKRYHMIDFDHLNQLKLQRFLQSWTFGKENARLQFQHSGGVVTDEGWDSIRKLQPNILKYIIEEMNKWYEY